MKLLFLANPTVGHTNYLIELASFFKEKGNQVHFALPGIANQRIIKALNNPALTINKKLETRQIEHSLIPISLLQGIRGMLLDRKKGLSEVLYALKVFVSGFNKYLRFLTDLCNKFEPDFIIYDYTFFPAIAVSEKLSIKRVAVYHSGLPFLEYPIPPIGTDLKYGEYTYDVFNRFFNLVEKEEQKIVTKIRKHIGIFDLSLIKEPNSNFLNIINTVPNAEYPRNNLPKNIHFVGPSTKITDGVELKTKKHNHIYVSLGTVFSKNPDLFERIIRSINTKETVIVAAGKAYKVLKDKTWNENIKIFEYVSQVEILAEAKLFITHGGKNSISESIASKTPMILFPAGGEQEYNANLVEWLGIGINFGKIYNSFTYNDMNSSIKKLTDNKEIEEKIDSINKQDMNVNENVYDLLIKYMKAD